MDIEAAIEALNRTGYLETHSTDKLLEFTCGSRILYLNRKSTSVSRARNSQIVAEQLDVGTSTALPRKWREWSNI